MSKIWLYILAFKFSIILIAIFLILWFVVSDDVLSDFRMQMLASLMGAVVAISVPYEYFRLQERMRGKKLFGMLKLVSLPYMKNHHEGLAETLKNFNDLCSVERLLPFFVTVRDMRHVVQSFDKSWIELWQTPEVLDIIKKDSAFNRVGNAIVEVLYLDQKVSIQSINAEQILLNDFSKLSLDEKNHLVHRGQAIRDDLLSALETFQRHVDRLELEVDGFLEKNGVVHAQIPR